LATLVELQPTPALAAAVRRMRERAWQKLGSARSRRRGLPSGALPALLPARVASGYLADIEAVGDNVFDPRLAAGSARTVFWLAAGALTRRF